jgi:hypothetical protein
METKDNGITHVKQVVRSVNELEIAPNDWPQERIKIIENLHDEVGDTSFRHAIEDLRFEAWDERWTRKARFIAKAAEMYDIPFGEASGKRLQRSAIVK